MAQATAVEDHILTSVSEKIMKIVMNRPEKKNALTRAMYTQLNEALAQAAADGAVRVVYITGTPGCFTSGNDLLDFMNDPDTSEGSPVGLFLKAISNFPKPVVAAVEGTAIGIGTTMLLHCDLVYAGTSARFKMPFVDLGLCPEAGSSFLLPKLMGHQRAAEYLLLGETFTAEKAKELGLANAFYDDAELQEAAWKKAQVLAARPPASMRVSKKLMRDAEREIVVQHLKREGEQFKERLTSLEAAEAFQAFAMRREPDFSAFE